MSLNLDADFLRKRSANFLPLTPLTFLFRSAEVFPDRPAIIYEQQRYTWREYARRCQMLASSLKRVGIQRGDVVAILAPNTPPMLEAHFGVPLAGGVLCTINVRLDAATTAYILQHSEATVFIVDRQWSALAKEALALLPIKPLVLDIDDAYAEGGERIAEQTYEEFLQRGNPEEPLAWPGEEFDAISLNYTSGTTSKPKGVLYHHRGAYLNALGMVLNHRMDSDSVYLWNLPLFHCNGWCFAWSVAALGATHVCLRKVLPDQIFSLIETQGVTHLCGAPTVLTMLVEGAAKSGKKLTRPVAIMTAGAAPPSAVLKNTEELGFSVRHVYGSTEMHGVVSICDWHYEWNDLPQDDRFRRLARQGVRTIVSEGLIVADPVTLKPVPRDGKTMGEILFRGNLGMMGYLKDAAATEQAFAGGWYHTGDLAVVHEDGYFSIQDRLKDIIISGGENISSIEIEDVLFKHPAVSFAAVVAMKHDRWGETPCAFVELKSSIQAPISEEELLAFCRKHLAKFKVPTRLVFGLIERTATGKVQKFKLRNQLQKH
ncbi:MAG: AMP-binding protein [Nevskia sp.]|nr:AMP-binding protein [Nevskia sp.]